jgi:hypothetical protein
MEDLNQVACLFLTGIHSYDDWTLDTHSDKGESFTIPRMVTALPDEGRSPRSRKSIASADNEHGSPEHDENQSSHLPTPAGTSVKHSRPRPANRLGFVLGTDLKCDTVLPNIKGLKRLS